MMTVRKVNLVFGGSGTNYPAYIGVYKAFYEEYIEPGHAEIGELSGTSGGAIIAALIACGYDHPSELERVVTEILPKDIIDWSWNPFYRLGLVKGKKFRKLLKEVLREDLSGSYLKYPLKVVVTNLDKEEGEVVDCLTTDKPISSVIYASACFPFVFSPVVINGDKYVDGGLSNNLPVDVFNNDFDTYAWRIDPTKEKVKKVNSFKQYLFRVLNILLKELTKEHLEDNVNAQVLNARGYSNSMDLWLTQAEAEELIKINYELAKNK